MVGRFENFLRDAARDHAPCCGKGQRIVVAAIFKTFSKNARIGDRSGYRAFRSRVRFLKMPESGIDPATVRFEVESRCTSILTVVVWVRAPPGGEPEPVLPPLKCLWDIILKNFGPLLQRRYSRL